MKPLILQLLFQVPDVLVGSGLGSLDSVAAKRRFVLVLGEVVLRSTEPCVLNLNEGTWVGLGVELWVSKLPSNLGK
eukprot:1044188-Prorocentrum_lima.AAC.1